MHIPFSNSNVNQYRKSSRPQNTQSTKAWFFFVFFFLTHLNFNRKWNFSYLWLTSVSVSCISPICLETMTCSRQDFAIIHNISGSTWRSWCNMNALLCVRLCYEPGPKNMTVTWMETNKFAFHDVAAHDFPCNGIAWNSNSQTAELSG